MSSVNKVILIGRLGKDPEVRRTQDGKPIASMSLAVSETWRDKASGERRERTEWVNVVIFNEGLAKVAEQYLAKGRRCYVEGALQTRKWQDREGNDRYSTEVVLQAYGGALVLLDSAERDDAAPRGRREEPRTERKADTRRAPVDDMDDEIPF